ncbi:MAG: OmpH family outer membrane protein [Bacteroidales bacterium]|nr:OmpH family outer membrane protein [Bacteroidales bacterium]
MKKLSLVLNVVLIVAVAVIYFLYFTGGKKGVTDEGGELNLPVEVTSHGIAYVNIDTVILNLDIYFDKREVLAEKQKKSETELNTKSQAYERGVRDYQDKVSKGLVTRATADEMGQLLTQQQQDLINLRDQLSYELMEEEQVMNRQILEYITSYLDSVKDEYNFQYILGKSFGGQILYSDKSLDITSQVLEGLNKKYQEEKAAAAKK